MPKASDKTTKSEESREKDPEHMGIEDLKALGEAVRQAAAELLSAVEEAEAAGLDVDLFLEDRKRVQVRSISHHVAL